jgi:hypothetical protein
MEDIFRFSMQGHASSRRSDIMRSDQTNINLSLINTIFLLKTISFGEITYNGGKFNSYLTVLTS